MNRSKKRIIAVLVVVVILGAIFSCKQFFSSDDDENNVIEIPEYSVKLNTDVDYQCIDVKEITANFEDGNVTSLDVKIGLLPGSDTFDLSDLHVHIRYIGKWGESVVDDYMLNGAENYPFLDLNIIGAVDPDKVWDRNLITPNSTITFKIEGGFGSSPVGNLKIYGTTSMLIDIKIDLKMPPFITTPSLYTKYGGMVLFNSTEKLDYPSPSDNDWIIENATHIKDQEIRLDKNLIVLGTGRLSFDNVTLKINCTNRTRYGIFVGEGAEFKVSYLFSSSGV